MPARRATTTAAHPKSRLAERLRDILREQIRRGRWVSRLPAERLLAEEFHVSRPSVHQALCALDREGLVRNERGHPWKLRKPIRNAARRGRGAEVIALHYDRPRKPIVLGLLIEALAQKLRRAGLALRPANPFTRGLSAVDKTLTEFDAANRPGFYLLVSVPPVVHRWFVARQIPALILGSRTDDVALPALDLDNEATMRHAVRHLIRRGHRRLALLTMPLTTVGAMKFKAAFLESCAEVAGIEGRVEVCAQRPEVIESAVHRVFARRLPPTAVITTSLEATIGLYTTLGLLGLRIPRDVSVVVCEHWPALEFLRPLPASYRIAWETQATRLTRLIRDQLQLGVHSTRFWKLLPAFHEGRSTATRSIH